MIKLRKILISISVLLILSFQPVTVKALEVPQAPAAPPPPPQQEIVAPIPPPAPTLSDPQPTITETSQPTEDRVSPTSDTQNADGNVGDTQVKTGDATNTALVTSVANNSTATGGNSPGGTTANTSDNGTGSDNQTTSTTNQDSTTIQNNTADIGSNGNLQTLTGSNTASSNVGNSTIESGDANTTGTLITAANTNIDGVMVSEFNIADSYQGDILLDFNQNCITGCGGVPTGSSNTGNGSGSENITNSTITTSDNSFQNNEATVSGNLILSSDSGLNNASKNTGGDSTITTGDANVAANVVDLLNNNVAGKVVVGVVNIFGDLIGDIILPVEAIAGINSGASNIGNGTDSQNTASTNLSSNQQTFQSNDANIENNLLLNANTGLNSAIDNTGGNSSIETGTASVDSRVINIANSNFSGGNIWLVIVNEAGKWIGRIIGAPDGSNVAGSSGLELTVGENGEVSATNAGNGSGSNNTASVNQENTTTTTQNNDAQIVNNLNLSANTGKNQANKNTGGDSTIITGDASIIANIINFVNNNIAGDSKVVVTIVNVFGSWLGDFVTPGQKKESQGSPAPAESNSSSTLNSNSNPSSPDSNKELTSNTPLSEPPVPSTIAPVVLPIYQTVSNIVQVAEFKQFNQTNNNPPASTLGISQTKQTNIPKINLAWVILLLPLILLIAGIKLLPKLLRRLI